MKRVRKYYTAEVKHNYSGAAWHRLEDPTTSSTRISTLTKAKKVIQKDRTESYIGYERKYRIFECKETIYTKMLIEKIDPK